MTIEAIAHTDVRGNQQKYLKITPTTGEPPLLINIGEKTFNAVTQMTENEKSKTAGNSNALNANAGNSNMGKLAKSTK